MTTPTGMAGAAHLPVRPCAPAGAHRFGGALQLGERGVLRPGRRRRLRALAWSVLLFFLTAAAFGLPLQAAVDLVPPGHPVLSLAEASVLALLLIGAVTVAALGSARRARRHCSKINGGRSGRPDRPTAMLRSWPT